MASSAFPRSIVSDSGTFWVRGKFNDSGCEGYDTIHVGFHPPTLIDETNLVITPTTCNGASGSITGLYCSWLSALCISMARPVRQSITAQTSMQRACQQDNTSLPSLMATAAKQFQKSIRLKMPAICRFWKLNSRNHTVEGRMDRSSFMHFLLQGLHLNIRLMMELTIPQIAFSPDYPSGTYVVRIRDVNGCEGFYLSNPVYLVDIPGPQVTLVNVTNETDFLGNGAIEIIATGSTPVIYYSIDSGATWQENDGNFYNLQSRIYNLQVKDENGCDTTFTVEIQNIILTYLHAITGEGGHCLGNTAMVPVNVDNFNSVATFHLKLSYNADNLQCEGFANVHPQLVDSLTGWVDQAAGEINLAWNSPSPVTFDQPEKVADLVFTTKNPGQGQLSWYTGATESYFTNAAGNPIPAEFQTGEVKIYEPPEIILDQSKTVCTGQFVCIMSICCWQPATDRFPLDLSSGRYHQQRSVLLLRHPGRCRPLHPSRHRPRRLHRPEKH